MFTTHGHKVPGTPDPGPDEWVPKMPYPCGGIEVCSKCKTDVDLVSVRRVAERTDRNHKRQK